MTIYLDLTILNLINTENWFDILSKVNNKILTSLNNNKLNFYHIKVNGLLIISD